MLSAAEIVTTISFGLFSLSLIAPANVLLASGLTLENIFHSFLGNEEISFSTYHLRRTTLLSVVISLLPLGYFLSLRAFAIGYFSSVLTFGCTISLVCFLAVLGYVYLFWYCNGHWTYHPTVKCLEIISKRVQEKPGTENEPSILTSLRANQGWESVAACIDNECRNIEKFTAYGGRGLISAWPGRRIIVTKSWILFSYRLTFTPILQVLDNISAIVVDTQTVWNTSPSDTLHNLSVEEHSDTGTIATVRIVNLDSGICPLTFSVPAGDLEGLREYLQCPLIIAQGVVLEPTIVQQFLEVFLKLVLENAPVEKKTDTELEQCIGCMAQTANACLLKRCVDQPGSAGCGDCRCRPMWCSSCLGRWFASRMAEAKKPPSDWLSSRVPCPTCRTRFCVRDVAPITAPS